MQVELLQVLAELKGRLREEDYTEAVEEVNAGEEGLALEVICEQLYEYEIRIPRTVYAKLQDIGTKMGMAPAAWEILLALID
jgi:ferritin-like protein